MSNLPPRVNFTLGYVGRGEPFVGLWDKLKEQAASLLQREVVDAEDARLAFMFPFS